MGVILYLRITQNRDICIQDFGDLELLERPCTVDWGKVREMSTGSLWVGSFLVMSYSIPGG